MKSKEMPQTVEEMWGTLGPITKFTLIVSSACTILFAFSLINPMLLLVDFGATFWNLQLWRPITATLFLGKFGFPWLFAIIMLVMYTNRNEQEDYVGRKADFIWMIVLIVSALHVAAFFLGLYLVSFAYIMALVWIWCRRHEDAVLSIYGLSFRATYFPWALMVFHLVMQMSIVDDIVGIVAGHAYYFAADMLPKTHGINLIRTPQFLYNWLPNQRLGPAGVFHVPASRGAVPGAAQPPRHQWGAGRPLGTG